MRDIVDRLREVADLKAGEMLPAHLYDDPEFGIGNWADGMSRLLNDAIGEIKQLRAMLKGDL